MIERNRRIEKSNYHIYNEMSKFAKPFQVTLSLFFKFEAIRSSLLIVNGK